MVFFYDTGIGLEHARYLYEFENIDILLYIQVLKPFPVFQDTIMGYGIVPKCNEFGIIKDILDKIDFIVFTDVGLGATNNFFKKLGFKTFGADEESQKLENDRIYMRLKFQDLGIPVQRYKVVKGIENLARELEKKQYYVKINKIRGNLETFFSISKDNTLALINQSDISIFKNEIEFILEEPFDEDFIEIGFDAYVSKGRFIKPYFFTLEYKGIGNLYFFVESSPFDDIMEKLEPYLQKNNYSGMLCMEGFFNGKRVYPTDITCRFPYPASSLHPRMLKSYYKTLKQVAYENEEIEIEVKAPIGFELGIYSYDKKIIQIYFPEELRYNIGFRYIIKIDGKYYYIPNDELVGTFNLVYDKEEISERDIVSGIREIEKLAKEIKGYQIYTREAEILLNAFYELLSFGYNPLNHLAKPSKKYITKFYQFQLNPLIK